MTWPGCESLRIVQTLNGSGQEKCKTGTGLFEVLSEKIQISAHWNNIVTPILLSADKG